MNKQMSTFERKMRNPRFKKEFEKGYKKLLFSELIISIMEGDDVSIRSLAREADISKSVIQNLRSGRQHDIKVSNLIKIAHAFGYEVILQRDDECLLLDEVRTKDSKIHLSIQAVSAA